jgi:Cu+-exporting ATPase
MAHVIRKQEEVNENEVEVPIEEVHRPREMIPTDGKIIEGSSSLDESAITGESIPVDKTVGQVVLGGTVNKSGLMKVIATKIGQDTVLSNNYTCSRGTHRKGSDAENC